MDLWSSETEKLCVLMVNPFIWTFARALPKTIRARELDMWHVERSHIQAFQSVASMFPCSILLTRKRNQTTYCAYISVGVFNCCCRNKSQKWSRKFNPFVMELKVWVDGVQRVVCGVSDQTTCQEVVIALARAIGK